MTELRVYMVLVPAAVSAGSPILGFGSDAMFPDVEQEGKKILLVSPGE